LAWRELTWADRAILTEGLMSPLPVVLCGIPAYFRALEKNPAITMRSALIVLSDLLAKLRAHVPLHCAVRTLDMSDLIKFAAEVNLLATLEVGLETAKVEITSSRAVVTMLPKAWQRVRDGPDLEDRAPALERSLRRLLAKQEVHERAEAAREATSPISRFQLDR